MDITLFENARSLTALYKNIPQLQDVEIIKLIVVPGEDLELILTLDTSELPEKLPLKWLDPKVNTVQIELDFIGVRICLLYTSPSPRDLSTSRMPSSA